MSVERKGQQDTPDCDDYDISETPSTMKVVQEDEEFSEKVIIYINNTSIVFFH